jgi:gliding motility-associated-like protein
MTYSTNVPIKKCNFKTLIFSVVILLSFFNSNLFAQAVCHNTPVDGPFFQDNGAITLATAKANGDCYTLPVGTGTQTVCFRYTYPSSGNVTFKYMLEYSTGAGCNNNTCSVFASAAYNNAGCLSPTACGASVIIKTYDNNCNFVMNNAGIGTTCGGGNFIPGQDYIVCFEVPLSATCTTTVCPIIGCTSGNCGCPATVTATAGSDQILCGVTSTTLTGNSASPGTGTWTTVSGPNTPTITSPNSASTTVTGMTTGTYTFRWTSVCGTRNGADDVIVTVNPNLVPAISSNVPVSCKGSANGTLTTTLTGGSAPYTYAWTPSGGTNATATGLSGGTYTITVTGGGCTKTATATISESSVLLAPAISSTTPVGCTGNSTGSLTASQTGGTGPFTYSWSPTGSTSSTISGLSAGSYTVSITDAYGCVKTTSGNITQPASALTSTITGTQSNVGCSGAATGSATVTGIGGTPAYTYSWSPGGQTTAGVSGLTAGAYNVTITDNNGCKATQTVNITQPASVLTSTITGTQSNVGCSGSATGSATVTGIGGTPAYTYSWSPGGQTTAGVSGLTAGTYNVTITDNNGCKTTQTVNITQPASVLTSTIVGTQSNVGCTGSATGSATVTGIGGTPAYTYNWSPGGQTTAGVSGLTAGTYSVTVTDNNGCTSVQTVNITQPASVLTSTITGTQVNVGCTGSATGSATVTGIGGTPAYTYNWSPGGQTTAGVSGLTAGTYSVTVTDNNGCTSVQTVNITQPASVLTSTITGTQVNVGCTGSATGSATVTGIGGTPAYTYNWSPGGQTTAGVSGLTAGTYNVTVTDNNGCTSVQTVNITQPASVLTSTIVGTQSNVGCTGSATGSATVTGIGGTPAYTYNWSPGGQTTAGVSGLTAGTYSVTVTDNNGCTSVQTVNITQPASVLTSTITGTQVNVGCTGSASGSATVTGIGGTPAYTYSWSPGGQTTAGVSGLTSGSYIVTITDANGCTATQTVAITQPASAVSAVASATDATCGGSNGTATVTGSGGTGGLTYLWTPSGQTTATAGGLSAGSYNVTVTDANGCTANALVSVNNLGGPTVGISSQVNVLCNGSGTGSATVTASGGTGTLTYLWNPGGQTTTTVSGLTAGTYIVTVTDANGCAQGQTITITQPATAINSGISSQIEVGCTGSSTGSLTATATGGTGTLSYLWSPGAETTATINGLTAGSYTVTITDANGCSRQHIATITQPVSVLSAVTGSLPAACGSSNGTVSVTASGGTPGYTYDWSAGGQTTAIVNGLTAGTYTVLVTDSKGCTQIVTATVAGSPGPSLTVSTTQNISCNGLKDGTATLTVSSGTAPYTYIWTPNAGSSAIVSGLSANTYTVVVSDSASCKDTVVLTITEPLPIVFTLSTSNATVCAGESLTLLTTTPTGGTPPFTFIWLPNGPVVSPLVPTTYSVTVTDSSGCISQVDTIRIIPLPSPIAGFDTISSGLFHEKFTFKDLSTGGDAWYWIFGDGTTSTLQNPYHTFPGAGTYTVTQVVTNTVTGCTDTITKIVTLFPNVLIPNVFTPNHDGINDEFWIPNTGFESFELTIYDRWGLKLFSTNVGAIRWDGRTAAGEEVTDGTYYFILKAVLKDQGNGKDYDTHGFINLCRGGGK